MPLLLNISLLRKKNKSDWHRGTDYRHWVFLLDHRRLADVVVCMEDCRLHCHGGS